MRVAVFYFFPHSFAGYQDIAFITTTDDLLGSPGFKAEDRAIWILSIFSRGFGDFARKSYMYLSRIDS
jgi:hypothetical protein